DDAATLHRLVEANRERLARWLPWAREGGPEAQERFVAERAMPSVARGPGLEAGIWLGDELIGAAGVHDVDVRSRSGAIGYWLDAAHEGKGVVTKVVRALVNRCFAEPLVDGEPFERLEVLAQVDNVRSRAVAERLGFTFEGVLRRQNLGPDRPDMAVYGLLRSEWEAASRDDGTGRAPAPAPRAGRRGGPAELGAARVARGALSGAARRVLGPEGRERPTSRPQRRAVPQGGCGRLILRA